MELGILDFCKYTPGENSRYPLIGAVKLAKHVESLGYTRCWLGEHHAGDVALCSPEVLIPVIAGYTRKIRIGAAGVLLGYYQPYKVAQTFRLLEALYPNRIDLGIASGRANPEFEVHLKADHNEDQRLSDKVRALSGYLHDPSLSHLGCPIGVAPPPVWLLGTRSAMRMAEQNSASLALDCFYSNLSLGDTRSIVEEYRSRFHANGLMATPKCCVAVAGVCADSDVKAIQHIERHKASRPWDRLLPRVVGSKDKCRDILLELTEVLDVHNVIFLDLCLNLEDRIRSYGLLADAVGSEKNVAHHSMPSA